MMVFGLIGRDIDSSVNDGTYWGPSAFAFVAVLIFTLCVISILLYLRRCRRLALLQHSLPQHHRPGHHRTLTITTSPSASHGETVLVYDEKMNLLSNTPHSPTGPIPEIRVTFPEEESQNGRPKAGRVVVLRIADSGSVGMEPLHKDALPPYQHSDAERFQSLDLERIGGLREKSETQPRYS